jgi:AcrR family transcriptional regulator
MSSSLVMHSLTITDLEEASGVPRSTIYYYVREGLLPSAQKAAASRAIYSDRHLALLQEIDACKRQGLSLHAIKKRLVTEIAAAAASEVDLVAEQNEQTRHAILTAAARLFVRKGYKRTRVADIMREASITPPVFYEHFPSKRDLFVEAFGVFVDWMRGFLESRLVDEPDPGARELARVQGYLGVQTLSPDLMALVRSEALHEDEDEALRKAVQRSYTGMTRDTLADLEQIRRTAGTRLPAVDELMAYGLLGGVENVVMRASWDGRYSRADVLWTTLCMFLAVEALYSGRLDLRAEFERYSAAVDRLAATPPPVPPDAVS